MVRARVNSHSLSVADRSVLPPRCLQADVEGYKREEALFPYPVLISKSYALWQSLSGRATFCPFPHSRKERRRGLQKPAKGGKWRTCTCGEDYRHTGWAHLRATGVLPPQLATRNHHCQLISRTRWAPLEASHCRYNYLPPVRSKQLVPPSSASGSARSPSGRQVQPHHSCYEQQRSIYPRTGPERGKTGGLVPGVSAKGHLIQATLRTSVQLRSSAQMPGGNLWYFLPKPVHQGQCPNIAVPVLPWTVPPSPVHPPPMPRPSEP